MMLTRDVRLTERELHYLERAAYRRERELTRSINRAHAASAAGATIQRGTLERHLDERVELRSARAALEVARQALARQLAHAARREAVEALREEYR